MATRTTNAQMEADLRDSVRPTWAPEGGMAILRDCARSFSGVSGKS